MSRQLICGLCLGLLMVASVWGQKNKPSSEPGLDNRTAPANVLGARPTKVLKIVKLKGVIRSVDLQKRSVVIVSGKKQELELVFAQPSGREQIKTSKKIFKATGKKKLLLNEVKVGSKVALQYYSTLGQMLELIVESTS